MCEKHVQLASEDLPLNVLIYKINMGYHLEYASI